MAIATPMAGQPGIARVVRDAWRGVMPARYDEPRTRVALERAVQAQLRPGQRILDVGSGAKPFLAPEERPADVRYVGLDVDADELAKAPAGWYDEAEVSDVTMRRARLEGGFDLIISNQVFEHVKPLDVALENMRAYLAPGGTMVTKFSGAYSIFALVNRVVPHRLAVWGLSRFLGDDPERIFPAHYDQCWDSALRRLTADWSKVDIEPLYMGAEYLEFLRPAQALYLGLEETWARRDIRNLAAYYVVTARR
jgi:2-polyprenyl-6-hydroxyphenyl methylase/3-demethylubiquinone-9 3-methyltransferase